MKAMPCPPVVLSMRVARAWTDRGVPDSASQGSGRGALHVKGGRCVARGNWGQGVRRVMRGGRGLTRMGGRGAATPRGPPPLVVELAVVHRRAAEPAPRPQG